MAQNNTIPIWWPKNPAIYDITKSYLVNADEGPFGMDNSKIISRKFPPKEKWTEFLGYKVASPIGVPAGPLLNSRWIGLASELGFDVLTYKTIRSCEFTGHPVPNMIYVDINEKEQEELAKKKEKIVFSTETVPIEMNNLAVTNSFGMPSRSPDYLRKDIPKAQSMLKEGQVMIVSVVGTPANEVPSHSTKESTIKTPTQGKNLSHAENSLEFLRDFVDTALLAKDCGAKIIEANFSCPNVATGEGQIFQSPKSVLEYGSAIKKAIGDTPFIIKIGNYDDPQLMKQVFKAAQEAGINCICGINSVSMKVLNPITKESALGAGRVNSGVCGGPIRGMALQFVKQAKQIIKEENLDGLHLMGCGGITLPEHFDEFLNEGVEVATTATGMMWDPYLGLRWQQSKKY